MDLLRVKLRPVGADDMRQARNDNSSKRMINLIDTQKVDLMKPIIDCEAFFSPRDKNTSQCAHLYLTMIILIRVRGVFAAAVNRHPLGIFTGLKRI